MKKPTDLERGLTTTLLREKVSYDPLTGQLVWVGSPRHGMNGKRAGYTRVDGYVIIKMDGSLYLAHRLVWLFVNGEWPKSGIDHINGNPSDNRIANLREAAPNENHWNMRLFKTNTSGYRGVSLHRKTGKWSAEVWAGGEKQYLGLFETKEEASSVVESKRSDLLGVLIEPYRNKQ